MHTNAVTAPKAIIKHVADVRRQTFSFQPRMLPGDTIATIDEISVTVESGVSTEDLVIDDAEPNEQALRGPHGEDIPVGNAVIAWLSGGSAQVVYRVTIVITTAEGWTLGRVFRVWVDR